MTKQLKKHPLPTVGGDEGEGGPNLSAHPHLLPPPSKGEEGTWRKFKYPWLKFIFDA